MAGWFKHINTGGFFLLFFLFHQFSVSPAAVQWQRLPCGLLSTRWWPASAAEKLKEQNYPRVFAANNRSPTLTRWLGSSFAQRHSGGARVTRACFSVMFLSQRATKEREWIRHWGVQWKRWLEDKLLSVAFETSLNFKGCRIMAKGSGVLTHHIYWSVRWEKNPLFSQSSCEALAKLSDSVLYWKETWCHIVVQSWQIKIIMPTFQRSTHLWIVMNTGQAHHCKGN